MSSAVLFSPRWAGSVLQPQAKCFTPPLAAELDECDIARMAFRSPRSEDLGKLLLRVLMAGLMLFHGVDKLGGVAWLEGLLQSKNIPGPFAYGVYVGEIIAPLLILVGWRTRIAALIFAFNMVVAVGLVHAGDVFTLGDHGAWALELHALYGFGALVIALIGPGRLSWSRDRSTWA